MATRKSGSRAAGKATRTGRKTTRRASGSKTGARKAATRKAGTAGTRKKASRPAAKRKAGTRKSTARSAKAGTTGARKSAVTRKAASRKTAPARKSSARSGKAGTAPARKSTVIRKASTRKTAGAAKPSRFRKPAPKRAASKPRTPDLAPLVADLREEKSELQELVARLQAERDSALAEAGRAQQRARELEEAASSRRLEEERPAGPGEYDPTVDLDEEPLEEEDEFDGTVGFFDRIEEIRARRIELDRERNDRELEQSSQPFWMLCPKCGEVMEEQENESIKLERCESCGGLYLDRGEVDLLLSLVQDTEGIRRLHNVLKF